LLQIKIVTTVIQTGFTFEIIIRQCP